MSDVPGVLFLDDEIVTTKYFTRLFDQRFRIFSATAPGDAMDILEEHHDSIAVVISDQRMPDRTGLEFLGDVRDRFPEKIRILTTAYTDLELLVDAINLGVVSMFVAKPWALDELSAMVVNAVEIYKQSCHERDLLDSKADGVRQTMLEDRVFEVGMVSARIGHYINNALCPMSFVIEQLIERGVPNDDLPLEFLTSTRDHLAEVARTLKDLEQSTLPIHPDRLSAVNIGRAAEEALHATSLLRESKGLVMDIVIESDLPEITADPSQIAKLLRFLIAEPVVSLPRNSRVKMSVSCSRQNETVVGTLLEVADDVQVTAKPVQSLLHPFNLRGSDPREFGVFLVSSYFIVRHHGGSLTARINDRGGLTISVFLPVNPDLIGNPNCEV